MDVKISPQWKEWIGREFDKPYFGQLVDFVKQEYAQRQIGRASCRERVYRLV